MMCDAIDLVKNSEIAAAMTLEALNTNPQALDERIHKIRGFAGAVRSAHHIREIMKDSEIMKRTGKNVQDAYALRSTPQVVGAVWDCLDFARKQFEIEINGVGDNPIASRMMASS
jgi:histidine ammonia-lyase